MPKMPHLFLKGRSRTLKSPEATLRAFGVIEMQSFLNNCCNLMRMHPIALPLVVKCLEHKPGVSGLLLIEESHIAAHTFWDTGEIYFDAFSCKPFNINEVKKFVADTFGVEILESEVRMR